MSPDRSLIGGFRSRQYDGTIQKADLTEHLVVDGETYRCASFYYLGDTLDGVGRDL